MNKYLTLVGAEFVYGGHLLSLGGAGIAYAAAVLLGIAVTPGLLLIVYLGFQAIYLYNRYKELPGDFLTNPTRSGHLRLYYTQIPLLVIFFLAVFFFVLVYFQKSAALFFGLITISLGLLYSISLKRWTGKIVGMKGVFVSLCWSTAVIFLVLYYGYPIDSAVVLIFIFVFLRWIVNTTIFDVKDIEDDQKKNLRTPAIVLGKERLVFLLRVLTLVSALPIVLGVYLDILPPLALVLLFAIPYSFYYLAKIKNTRPKEFVYNVIVDGEFLLWALGIFVGTWFYGPL